MQMRPQKWLDMILRMIDEGTWSTGRIVIERGKPKSSDRALTLYHFELIPK